MMSENRSSWKGLCLSVVALLFVGCIKQDYSLCYSDGVCLVYEYTANIQNQDKFKEMGHSVLMLIFDEDGNYYDSKYIMCDEMEDGNRYRLDVDPGRYKIVFWGNYVEEYFSHDTGVDIASTRLWVDSDMDNCISRCGSLFHGYEEVEIRPRNNEDHHVPLSQSTNSIKTILEYKGASPATKVCPGTDFSIRILGFNSTYGCDNALKEESLARQITYLPTYMDSQSDGTYVAEFNVLKMYYNGCDGMEVVVRDEASDKILYRLPLVKEILRTDPNVSTERDIDIVSDYTVRFLLDLDANNAWVVTNVYINDWDVSTTSAGI